MPIIYLVRKDSIPVYVGFTSYPLTKRWRRHITDCAAGRGCRLLCRAITKYGADAFTVEEIYSNDDAEHTLKVMEPHFIREHHTHHDEGGYNISHGGDINTLGRKCSEETREKLRQSHLGKKLSEDHKEKIRVSLQKKFSEYPDDLKKKMISNLSREGGKKGKKHTKESREKMRLSQLARRANERILSQQVNLTPSSNSGTI